MELLQNADYKIQTLLMGLKSSLFFLSFADNF